jgi:hypothetical protein
MDRSSKGLSKSHSYPIYEEGYRVRSHQGRLYAGQQRRKVSFEVDGDLLMAKQVVALGDSR